MKKELEVLGAIRARMALAYPNVKDYSGDPYEIKDRDCPAFAVQLSVLETERIGMGADHRRRVDALATISAWAKGAPNVDLEATLYDFAEELARVVIAPPADLGGVVWDISAGEPRVEVAKGTSRIGRLELDFDTQFIDPGISLPALGGFSAGFTLGFS